MRICRDDADVPPAVGDARIFLFLFQPGELARQLLALRRGHGEFEQEAAGGDVADLAIELTEITEIGCDAIPDLADHRHGDQHPEWRNAAGPARAKVQGFPCESNQFASV